MTELEKYENCKKERELIIDFFNSMLKKRCCFNLKSAIDEYFGIDRLKLEAEINEREISC